MSNGLFRKRRAPGITRRIFRHSSGTFCGTLLRSEAPGGHHSRYPALQLILGLLSLLLRNDQTPVRMAYQVTAAPAKELADQEARVDGDDDHSSGRLRRSNRVARSSSDIHFVAAAHFSSLRPVVHLLDRSRPPGSSILSDHLEYAYLAGRSDALNYFRDMSHLVSPGYLRHRLSTVAAVVVTSGRPEFPSGFANDLPGGRPAAQSPRVADI